MKNTSGIIMICVLSLITATGFLAVRHNRLDQQVLALEASVYQQQSQNERLVEQIGSLRQEIVSYQGALSQASEKLGAISSQIQSTNDTIRLVATPEYVPTVKIYQTLGQEKNEIRVVGDRAALNSWKKSNDMYLEHIARKTFHAKHEPATGAVVIEDIVPNSIYYQLGLRFGDKITAINSRPAKVATLWNDLLTSESKFFDITREGKKYTYTISIEDTRRQNVDLPLTRAQFLNDVKGIYLGLTTSPAVRNGNLMGVKIDTITQENLLTKFSLQPNDIITKINDQDVNQDRLQQILTANALDEAPTGQTELRIEYLRQNQPATINVGFNK